MNDVRRGLELGAFEPLDHDIIVHVFERVRGVFLDVLAEVHDSLAVRALILLEVRLFEYFPKPVILNHFSKLFRILFVFIYVCFLSDEVFDHFILSEWMLADSIGDFVRVHAWHRLSIHFAVSRRGSFRYFCHFESSGGASCIAAPARF